MCLAIIYYDNEIELIECWLDISYEGKYILKYVAEYSLIDGDGTDDTLILYQEDEYFFRNLR